MTDLQYGIYTDNAFNINNYQIGYRYLRVETKRSWGSLNIYGGYWNMLRISLHQVDNETTQLRVTFQS